MRPALFSLAALWRAVRDRLAFRLIGLFVAAILIATTWSIWTVRTARNDAVVALRFETESAAARLANGLRALELVMQTAAEYAGTVGRIETLRPYLVRLTSRLPMVRTISVADPEGLIRVDLRPSEPARGIDISDRAYFRAHLPPTAAAGYVYSPPLRSRVDGRTQITLSLAIRDRTDNALRGVIAASIDERYFAELAAGLARAGLYDVSLRYRDGRPVYHLNRVPPRSGGWGLVSVLKALSDPGERQHHRSAAIAFTDLSLHLSLPAEAHLAPAAQEVGRIWAIVGLLTLLLAGLLILSWRGRQLRRAHQEEQRLTGERLKLVTGPARIGLWDYDVASGAVAFDDEMLKLYGQPRPDGPITLALWESWLHPADGPAAGSRFRACLTEARDFTLSFRIVTPTGRVRHMDCIASVLRAPDGSPRRVVGINQDVTDSVDAARKLRDAKETAERANRAKSYFLSEMSHELRTPLTAVIGYAQMLTLPGLSLSPEQRVRYVKDIECAGQSLLRHIDDILSYSELESGDRPLVRERLNPRAIVAATLAAHRPAMRAKGLRLEAGQLARGVRVLADAHALRDILDKVLDNAIGYSPDGGRVRVASQITEEQLFWLCVIDQGPGVPEADLDLMLEPFTRGKHSHLATVPGTGLGLAVALSLAQSLDGDLALQNAPGGGLQVDIRLPLAPDGGDPNLCTQFGVEVAEDAKHLPLPS